MRTIKPCVAHLVRKKGKEEGEDEETDGEDEDDRCGCCVSASAVYETGECGDRESSHHQSDYG